MLAPYVRLSERQHCAYGIDVRLMDAHRSAQLAFVLCGFLGQNVTLEGLTALDGSTWTHAKALLRAAFRLHFWHNNICPEGSSIFSMIAGGNISLLLDACSHLFCSSHTTAAIAPTHQAIELMGQTNPIFSFWAPEP